MKIICVGRNYAKHARELGNEVPSEPVIFTKPDSSLIRRNFDFYYPEITNDLHFECEIVYRVAKEGKYVQKEFAKSYVDGIALGIDFTARDLQSKAKENGLPWALAKGFNGSAPVSVFVPIEEFPDLSDIKFEFRLNNELRQQGHTANMLFSIEDLIVYITRYMTIKKGDMIFTGTPEGVGPVQKGDHLLGHLEGRELLNFYVR